MAWTQTDIDTLKSALATGELQVQYPNGMVKYRSYDEMKSILADMEAEVNASNPPTTRRFAQVSKGL
jgi:hypothetical protein